MDCIIQGNGNNGIHTAYDTEDCVVEGCSIFDNPDGIDFLDCLNLSIVNCNVYNNGRGIVASHCQDITLSGNYIVNNTLTGLVIEYTEGLNILDCWSNNNLDHGFFLGDSWNIVLENCTAFNNTNNGFYINYCQNILAANCESYQNSGDGCYLHYCENGTLTLCDSHGNLDDGYNLMNLDHVNLELCCIYNNSDDGAYASYSNHLNFIGCSFQDLDFGAYLGYTYSASLYNCVFSELNYGLYFNHAKDSYVSESQFSYCNYDGIFTQLSEGVIVTSNFTDNADEGIEGTTSNFRVKYCTFDGNSDNGADTSGLTGRINATLCYWGNETGPHNPISNPDGKGDSVDGFVRFIPWQTEPYQPDALISNLRCQLSQMDWRVVYPDQVTPKPLGCGAALTSDWLASAFVTTKLPTYVEGLDTNSSFVNQTTGEAEGEPEVGIITFGGPFVNPVVKRAEDGGTPEGNRAPVKFYSGGDTFYYQYANGTNIPGAELPLSVINVDEDLFVIETYTDGDGRLMVICYGFGWPGTYAAGKFFDTVVFPHLASFTDGWIVVHWEDSNADGFVNDPGEGDTYTVIATGN
jgi:parallel beta-helix repeat protein